MASKLKGRTPPRRKPTRETPKPKTPKKTSSLPRVTDRDVELIRTKGTPERGGGTGGEAWRIMVQSKRAGIVFINFIDEPPIGPHASIQIFLNVASQGRHIGRFGYLLACRQSRYDQIYAHMRKSNVASRRAAEAAGFTDVTPPRHPQLIMRWQRQP
jgi:RimJ/RimL family protein N-acetyltransferase